MVTRGDSGITPDIQIGSTERYVLARDIEGRPPSWSLGEGVAWWRPNGISAQEGDIGEEVTAVWDHGWIDGMGEAERVGPNSKGYALSANMVAAQAWFVRLGARLITATPAQVPSDVPTYFFEVSTATRTYVYAVAGRFAWKMNVEGSGATTAINIYNEKDFGVGASAGMPAFFEGKWYIPLGSSVLFVELTTISDTDGVADTYTNADGGTFALHFATYQDGSTAKLARGYSTNLVALAATAPLTSGSWGSGFEVGDTSSAITGMADTGISLFIGKTDGLYKFDGTGNAFTVLPMTKGTGAATNGVGMYAVPNTETVLYNHQTGLWAVQGERAGMIGPDEFIDTNGALANVSAEAYRGTWLETTILGRWIYAVQIISESGTDFVYHWTGYMRGGNIFDTIWHSNARHSGIPHRGSFIDSSQRWWGLHADEIIFIKIGRNGSPDAGRDALGYGRATAPNTGTLHLPNVPFYRDNGQPVPHTLKQLRVIEVVGRNIDATTPLTLSVLRDDAAAETVSTTITSSGLQKRYWTAGSNDTCYKLRPVLSITPTVTYDNTTGDPQIWSVIIRAILRPDLADVIHFVVDCTSPYADGTPQERDPEEIRDDLLAHEGGASVSVIDPGGNTIALNITKVGDIRAFEVEKGVLAYHITCEAQERVTS